MKKIIYCMFAALVTLIPVSCNGGKSQESPLLSALNINGRAKIVCYDDQDAFSFNADGSTVEGEKGPDVTLVSNENGSFELSIVDGQLKSIFCQPMMFAGYKIVVTSYDNQNRPATVDIYNHNEECKVSNAKVSYPNIDEKGSWLTMHIDYEKVDDLYAPSQFTRTIEYWPDNVSADASLPKVPTEEFLSELIINADKPNKSLWSSKLKSNIDEYKQTGMISYNPEKLFDLGDVPSEAVNVRIVKIDPSAGYTSLNVAFTYQLQDGGDNLSDQLIAMADIVYENNEWRINDIGYNAWSNAASAGHYFAQDGWLSEKLEQEFAKRFLYNAYYDKDVRAWEDGYSTSMLNKFKDYKISSELNYPENKELSNNNSYYKSFYSDDFNRALQQLSITEEKCTDGIIGFDWDIFWGGQEGPYKFDLSVKECYPGENNCLILVTDREKYALINNNGRWYIDNIGDLKQRAIEIANEYK